MSKSKIGVIGAGNVGAAIINALVLRNIGKELILFNRDKEKALAEVMDIDDTIPLLSEMQIKATNDYKDLEDCSIIAITVGARQKEDETRLELLGRNAKIMQDVVSNLDKYASDAILLIVSNPVDILTRVAQETSARAHNKIFGSGTVLDTSRLRYQLGKELEVNRKNVHVHVIGEHGDNEFAVWSNAIIGSIKLEDFPLKDSITLKELKDKVMSITKKRAYEIIQRKGYTNFGVAVAVAKLIQCVIRDEKKIFSVSIKANKEYLLHKNTVLSLPCVIGRSGVENRLILTLSKKEKEKLLEASNSLNNAYKNLR